MSIVYFVFLTAKQESRPWVLRQKGYATEAAISVRDWTFRSTPFNMVYSYMKHTNEPSARTAMAYGCRQVDEFVDEENGITKVFAISREEAEAGHAWNR